MTPQEIMDGMTAKNRMLTQKNKEYLDLSEKWAQAKKDYRVALAKEMLKLKADGIAVSASKTIAQGSLFVADSEFQMNVAEAVKNACLDAIKDIRIALESYRSLLSWLKSELQSQ
jgi:hypothetical protein